ncbi:DUF1493 family protein [Cyanobacterium aponinum UTEX 3221]|nr:DUF1493 family protein [Cyanobacterium aponinum]WRL38032.1 DUF1493 family protein [Cyanobacterium aponinum UTEX 3221]
MKVKEIVSQVTGYDVSELSLKNDLYLDLGVDGDDAVELLEQFSQEFQIDMSDFKFEKYFGCEAGFTPFTFITTIFFSSTNKFKSLTIEKLINIAQQQKWSD